LMANTFNKRQEGDLSQGSARAYFRHPQAINITVGNTAFTATGLKFFPTTAQSFSAEQMMFNTSGDLYYVDLLYQAEKEGDEYNIAAGVIIGITGLSSAVKVTNLFKFRDGLPTEDTITFVDRGGQSLSERSLNNKRGALAKLTEAFSDLRHMQSVGFGDPEMERDIIKGGGYGRVILWGDLGTGATSDDGDGDGYTPYFTHTVGGLYAAIGPAGPSQYHILTVDGVDRDIVAVISDDTIKVQDLNSTVSTLSDALSGENFSIRKKELTLSDIPGGIVEPNGPNGTIVIENDEVHVGGMQDIYIRGGAAEEKSITLETADAETPVMIGTHLETHPALNPTDVVRDAALTPITGFLANRTKPGMTLRINNRADLIAAGLSAEYQIIKVVDNNRVQVYPAPPAPWAAADAPYAVINSLDIDLHEPKNIRGSGTDLITLMHSKQVSTVSAVNWTTLGGLVGDTLRITGVTSDEGDHVVESISGAGNKYLNLQSDMKRTASNQIWQLFKKGTGIEWPLLRLTTIDLLDTSKKKTGNTIPYADPVDIQTTAFSNIGIGEKELVADARLGIIGSMDIVGGHGVTTENLRFYVNDTLYICVFTNPADNAALIAQINAVVPNIASLITIEGGVYVSLRSTNRWIQVDIAGSVNTLLGFSTTEREDNRQLISPSIPDWDVVTSKIYPEKDVAYIMTGNNVGQYFIHHSDTEKKLLISRVDENGKAVFPLSDPSATVRIGNRSLGKARCYFLQPTSFEVLGRYRGDAIASTGSTPHRPNLVYGSFDEDEIARTEFEYDVYGDQSAIQCFFPDPELKHQVLPATSEDVPNNLKITSGTSTVESESAFGSLTIPGQYSRNAEIDFLLREIRPGDLLEITYQPIQGAVDISVAVFNYALMPGKTLVFSIENGDNQTVTFSPSCSDPDKLVAEINAQLATTIAYVEDTGVFKYLRLEADFAFTTKAIGVNDAHLTLGLTAGDNDANAKGTYDVITVGYLSGAITDHMKIDLDTTFLPAEAGNSQHFKIHRPGVQRVCATDMEDNFENGLYYADIELISEGCGNEFSLTADKQLSIQDHQSDGWTLEADDENLTFSMYERLTLCMSRRFLPVGSTDKPSNMIHVVSQNLQVGYERAALVEEVQSYASSELDRIENANILIRHLQPHFILITFSYKGGSKVSIVETDIESLIDLVMADEELQVDQIVDILKGRGATAVTLPIVLVGVVHRTDRSIWVVRSEDAISNSRFSTFIADTLAITRETT